jgi:predicted RNA binding protein YcfA (HicA-like mRNA interferase family)
MDKVIWDQLKNITSGELKKALEKDQDSGWYKDETGSSATVYRNDNTKRIVSIHTHPYRNYGPGQLKELINDIGWTEKDLRRLKLIK